MLKFGTHIEIHQLRDLDYSKEDAFAHAHVPRAQRLKKSPCYILTTTGPIVLKFGIQLETKQLIRFLRARSLIAQKASYWFYHCCIQLIKTRRMMYNITQKGHM